MKTLLLILFPALLHAQLYMGSFLGYSHSSYVSFNYNTQKQESFTSEYLFYSMPIGYQYNSWLIESGGTYDGSVYANLLAGRNFPLSENLSIDLLAGTGDALEITFHKLRLAQYFKPEVTARLRWKAFAINAGYVGKTYLVGIGIIGFINK